MFDSVFNKYQTLFNASTALHCIALFCTELYCTALYLIVLYSTVMYCTVLMPASLIDQFAVTVSVRTIL